MSGRLRIARRELASLKREKTIVLAIGIQLFIAGFSSFLLVGLVSMYDPGSVGAGGITIGVAGDAGDDLAASIENKGNWQVVRYESTEEAREAFDQGRVASLLIAEQLPNGRTNVEAYVPDGSINATVIVVQVREALQVYEREKREEFASELTRQPRPVPNVPDGSPTFSFTYTVLIPLLAFLPTFISGSVASDAITEELDSGTIDLLRVTPLSAAEIADGKMLAMIALAPAQAAAWLALLWLNGTGVSNPIPILGLVTGVAGVLVALGVGIALVFEERQSAQLIYSLAVLAVFVGGSVLPESPPNTVAKLAIGSANVTTYGFVVLSLVLAAGAYAAVRRAAERTITTE